MGDAPERLVSKATFLTTQLAGHAHRLAGEAFARAGAGTYHYRILVAVHEHGPTSQADLGRSVTVDRSDVTAAVGALEAAGMVERRPDEKDARRRIVHLTEQGEQQLERLEHELERAQAEYLEPLTEQERTQLRELLARLLAHHGSTG